MARGKKITDESERRVNVTIRLDRETLSVMDEIIRDFRSLKPEVEEHPDLIFVSFRFPENRTELISWILNKNLTGIRNMLSCLALENILGIEEMEIHHPETYDLIDSNNEYLHLKEVIRSERIRKKEIIAQNEMKERIRLGREKWHPKNK